MKKLNVLGIFLIIVCMGLTGCATIVRGTSQTVPISSTPSGADVKVSDGFSQQVNGGLTPTEVILQRKYNYKVTISKPGYMEEVVDISSAMDGAILGNILFGGIIGILVDAADGASQSLNPRQIFVNLKPDIGSNGIVNIVNNEISDTLDVSKESYTIKVKPETIRDVRYIDIFGYEKNVDKPYLLHTSKCEKKSAGSAEFLIDTQSLSDETKLLVKFKTNNGWTLCTGNLTLGQHSPNRYIKLIIE